MTKRKIKTTKKKSAKKKPVGTNKYKSYIRLLWAAILLGLILVAGLFMFISKTQLPDTKELEQPEYEIATIIKATDGQELGKAFTLNRIWLTAEEINPIIVDALVSTEDERYFEHCGIDTRSLARAILFLGSKGGASTITQQLAKLFFTQRSKSFVPRVWQKLKEWVIAIEFEKQYTKEEILAMYLNKYDYLHGAIGIGSAARTYFGKDQSELGVEEAAVLVGLLKNPWIFNPISNPENANKRRAVVMKQMVKNDKLDKIRYKELNAIPIDVSKFKREKNYGGIAPYFRAELASTVKKILAQKKYSKPDGTKYDLYTDGLIINTTIDIDMQRHAEASLTNHMSKVQDTYFKRWKGMDPWTYGADDKQKKERKSNLLRQIRETDRFKKMRKKYMGTVSSDITQNIEKSVLRDADIFRLFAEAKKPGTLATLVNRGTISKSRSKVYKEILVSDYWPTLKAQWSRLQRAKDKIFKKKVKMKIFAYNEEGEKTVEMSPLDSIRYHNMHLQLGSVSIDPQTGHIKTWVGGIGHKYFKFDHVNSNRQVGSTFKPFVYGTAIIEKGISPCEKVKDQQYIIPANDPNFGNREVWDPGNASKFTNEYVTLKEGLKKSLNSVSVYLLKEIGNVEPIRQFAASLGIPKEKIPPYPSIALGVPELSVMEMAGAYTTFANDGVYTSPVYIKTIEDANGRIIYNSSQSRKRAISTGYNYAMIDMLQYAQTFAKNKNKLKSQFGGKTGTTNDHKNGWFMGVTPDLVVSTWVGGDNEWIRFLELRDGQGGVMARPFCTNFISRLENDPNVDYDSNAKFKVPDDIAVTTDCSIYATMEADDIKAAEQEQKEKESEEDEFGEEF